MGRPEGSGPQDHGGNRREVARRYGLERLLDFSASINPLGHPDGLWAWLQARSGEVLHYPDRDAAELVDNLARRFGLPWHGIRAGNGSAELIDLLFRALEPRRLILCPPDFGLYRSLAPKGLPICEVPRLRARHYGIDAVALGGAVREGDLVLLSNPANPSGCLASRDELRPVLDRCEELGATLAVDEAFADFCPGEALVGDAPRRGGLVVLRSMTKYYGIPGIRLGFLAAAPELVARIASIQIPWSVSALAQAAGVFCLSCKDWDTRTLTYVARTRQRLRDDLGSVAGLRPVPSRVNYLLVELTPPAPGAAELYEALARRGVLIRHCGSFGLGERYVRVAVRTEEENRFLVESLKGICAGSAGRGADLPAEPREARIQQGVTGG